jgi:ribonuclease Y
MSNIILIVVIGVIALAVGVGGTLLITRMIAKSKAGSIIKDAQLEAEVLKKNKIIEAKEEEMAIKTEAEKQAAARLSKVQSAEAKMKQREMQLNQQQADVQRRRSEIDAMKVNLQNQLGVLETKKSEVDKMQKNVQDTLEHVSGLSAEEAKEKLVESLKDEAKTAAASYVNDIMDDAKLTANKEAKRIIVQSIQRVATETAIENAVTVFHIDNDEIKGRIIGPRRAQHPRS